MGIPKFFRWLSERYPLSSHSACPSPPDYATTPVTDNFYLDLNGVIHPCSHPDDDNPHFKRSMEMMVLAVFEYIDGLVKTVRPRKVVFMAVDGVAPRAKLNQQRARRFQSKKNRDAVLKEARDRGEDIPDEVRPLPFFLFSFCLLNPTWM